MLGHNIRKVLSALLTGLMMISLALIYPETSLASDSRLAGSDKYRTAVEIAQAGWKESEYVILVRGDDYADALCAGPLAGKYNAPILFTEKYSLNSYTLMEIRRLKADKVIIIGGYGAISRSIDNTLDSEGIDEVERIYGDNRFETSVKIAQRLGSKEVALATGGEYADALSVSAIAAVKGFAILLTNPNSLPKVVEDHLKNYKIAKVYIIGGEKAISKSIESQVGSSVRLAGENRYATNCLVLKHFEDDFDFNRIFAAPGEGKDNYTYALAGAVLAAQTSSPIVLNSSILPEETKSYIQEKMTVACKIIVLGNTNVVPTSVVNQYRQGSGNVLKSIFDQKGTYGPSTGTATIAGSLAIEEDDIIVQNTVIEGDLLLGEGIGNGTVRLENVTVKGRTTIRGGWDNRIIGDSLTASSVIIDLPASRSTELVLLGKSKVQRVDIFSDVILNDSESSGDGFSNVSILNGQNVFLRGDYNTVSVSSNGGTLILNTATVKILNMRTGGNVWGTGTISNANISSNNAVLYIIPTVTNVAKGYFAYIGGEMVPEGKFSAIEISQMQNEPINNLIATAGNGKVSFTFSKPDDATSVVMKQSTNGTTWKNASTGTLNKNSTSATATGLTNGQKYYFKLVVTGGIRAGESNTVSATPVGNSIDDLAGSAGNGQVTLYFSAPTGATQVIVKQSADGGLTWVNSSTTALNAASRQAVVSGLTNGITYRFKLVVEGGDRAGESNDVTLTPVEPIDDLIATPEAAAGEVTLSFSKPTGATRVTLMESTDGEISWHEYVNAELDKNSTAVTLSELVSGQEYIYKLMVIGGARAGESNVATVIPN